MIDATSGLFVVLLFRVEVVDQQSAAPSITQIPTKKEYKGKGALFELFASAQSTVSISQKVEGYTHEICNDVD